MEFAPIDIKKVLAQTSLSKLQQNKLLHTLEQSNEVSSSDYVRAGVVWTLELMKTRFPTVDSEQHWSVIENFLPQLLNYFSSLYKALCQSSKDSKPQIPIVYLGIGDRSHACISSFDKLLDLNTGELVEGTTTQFLETIQYNLGTLFTYKLRPFMIRN